MERAGRQETPVSPAGSGVWGGGAVLSVWESPSETGKDVGKSKAMQA